MTAFPSGKLPPEILSRLLDNIRSHDSRVIIGPRPGEDAAVIDIGQQYLVAKTDPITFATDEIGWYAVHVNANDIAVMGATPLWFMASILLPGGLTDQALVDSIFDQMGQAAASLNVTLVGGHTEVTPDIVRPIVAGMMLGLVEKDDLILTSGAQDGDMLILTKGVPIEATAIIARERKDNLLDVVSDAFLNRSLEFLHEPGISVVRDARIATAAGRVHAMHDPTEGGIATGLWEMAEAADKRLVVDCREVVMDEGAALCQAAGINPLGASASGALLLSAHPDDAPTIIEKLEGEGIRAYQFGHVEAGSPEVLNQPHGKREPLFRPQRDEIFRLFVGD